MSIFKACDIRGLCPGELTPGLFLSLGRALAAELGGGTCVVGGDVRLSTRDLKRALCSGCDVLDLGILPTPVVYWAAKRLGADGAAIVTASHNPPEFNGLKFMLGERPVVPGDIERLRRRVEDGRFRTGDGRCEQRSVRDDYLGWLHERFGGQGDGRSCLIDAGNGCQSQWAPAAFRDAGYEVTELNCRPDGAFPGRPPDPSAPANLERTRKEVASVRPDFAVAFDGDGDRAVFLDENGAVVESDRAIMIFVRETVRRQPGAAVVYDLKCTDRVAEEVRRRGGRPLRERSGHAFIKRRMLEEGAAFAGEASGHFFFEEIGGDDGLYAALRMGEILARNDRPFSTLVKSLPPGGRDAGQGIRRLSAGSHGRCADRS